MMKCTEQKDVDVWVATLAVGKKEASRMGIMKVNEDHHIIDFYEKPNSDDLLERMKTPKSALKKMGLNANGDREFLGSMGIYLFRRSALFELLLGDKRDDFGKHLIPSQVKKGRIAAFVHEGYWEDIGTIDSSTRPISPSTRKIHHLPSMMSKTLFSPRPPTFQDPDLAIPGAIVDHL